MPMGTGGGAAVIGRLGSEKPEAGLPIRTAIACSYCARKMPRLVNRGLSLLEGGLRFHHGDLIADARVVLCLRQIQGLLIGGDRFGVKLDQSVLSAYLEKVFGKVGLFGEPLVLQIRTADLGGILRIADFIADSAKEIRRPGNIQRQRIDLRRLSRVGVVLFQLRFPEERERL
jgi:hypothetical protein